MAAKLGSFRYSLAERRERLLSQKTYSVLGLSDVSATDDGGITCCSCSCLRDKLAAAWRWSRDVAGDAWRMGRSDPRKAVFAAKMGLALVLISLLIFLKEPIKDLARSSVWAILTVVVVFEFSIGATLSKGFNRGLGTLSAGGLALGMAELSKMAGDAEEVFIVVSIFIVGLVLRLLLF